MHMVVFSPTADEAFASVAADVAADRGERVVETLPEDGDEPVVYVAPFHELDTAAVDALGRRLVERGPTDGRYSVVTGRTAESARALYRRAAEERPNHAFVFRGVNRRFSVHRDDVDVFHNEETSLDRMRDLQAEGLSSFSYFSSAPAIHFNFDGWFLCGVPKDAGPGDFTGQQPYCVQDGEVDCPREGELVPVEEFDAAHVFLPNCCPVLPTNVSDMPIHVVPGFLERARSLIGTYRLGEFYFEEVALHYAMLRAGYDVVERVHVLNQSARRLKSRPHQYVPIGRPSAGIASPRPGEYDVSKTETDDGVRVTLSDVDAHLVEFTVPDDAVGGTDWVFVQNRTEAARDVPLSYVAFPEAGGDRHRVLVYAWGPITLPELELVVAGGPRKAETRETAARCLRNVQRLQDLSVTPGKVDGQVSNLANHLAGLPDDETTEGHDLNEHFDVVEKVERVADSLERIEDELVDGVSPYGSHYHLGNYFDRVEGVAQSSGDHDCAYCGGPLTTRTAATATGDARRLRGTCAACGEVFDAPADDDRLVYPVFEGDLFDVAESPTFHVAFENPADHPQRVVVAPWLHTWPGQSEHRGRALFTPEYRRATLDPGERRRFEFAFDPDAVMDNQYWFIAHAFADLQAYGGAHRVIVGDSSAGLPVDPDG